MLLTTTVQRLIILYCSLATKALGGQRETERERERERDFLLAADDNAFLKHEG